MESRAYTGSSKRDGILRGTLMPEFSVLLTAALWGSANDLPAARRRMLVYGVPDSFNFVILRWRSLKAALARSRAALTSFRRCVARQLTRGARVSGIWPAWLGYRRGRSRRGILDVGL